MKTGADVSTGEVAGEVLNRVNTTFRGTIYKLQKKVFVSKGIFIAA